VVVLKNRAVVASPQQVSLVRVPARPRISRVVILGEWMLMIDGRRSRRPLTCVAAIARFFVVRPPMTETTRRPDDCAHAYVRDLSYRIYNLGVFRVK
jgi:hypothetical protein